MGMSTSREIWNALKTNALATMARQGPNRGNNPPKMKPRKNISSVKGVMNARAWKVRTRARPSNMMSDSTAGGDSTSTSSQSTMPAYKDVANKLVAKTTTISNTVRFLGQWMALSPSAARGFAECRKPKNHTDVTMNNAIKWTAIQVATASFCSGYQEPIFEATNAARIKERIARMIPAMIFPPPQVTPARLPVTGPIGGSAKLGSTPANSAPGVTNAIPVSCAQTAHTTLPCSHGQPQPGH